MKNTELIVCSTLLYQSKVLLDLQLVHQWLVLQPQQRCNLLTISSQLLIKLSMKQPNSDIALVMSSIVAPLQSDPLMVQSVTVHATIPNHQKPTLPIPQVQLLPYLDHLFKQRDFCLVASDLRIPPFSSSQRFYTELLRKKYLQKTTRFLQARLK